MRTIVKGTAETLIHQEDYTHRLLSGDYIASSSWSVASGLTGSADTYTGISTQITLSGGTVDTQYKVSNTVTTSLGEVIKRSFKVLVRTR